MDSFTFLPTGEPTMYWVTPISANASIFGANSSGVPHTENASSKSSVTAPIAPPKSPLPNKPPIFSLIPAGNPCLSNTGAGEPAAINATTILAAFLAASESVPIEVAVYAPTSKLAIFFPAFLIPFSIIGNVQLLLHLMQLHQQFFHQLIMC